MNARTAKTVRWLPAVVVPALVVAGAVAIPAAAEADSGSSGTSASQVLALIAKSGETAYSGRIEQSSDLGLPQLPTNGVGGSGVGASAGSVIDLLSASHAARVFVDGASKSRVQVLDQLAERDVIRNGSSVWLYDSKQHTATHLTLPSKSAAQQRPTGSATPSELAKKLLAHLDPSTKVAVGDTASVAGRGVYTLTLTPKSSGTLVGSTVLSVDRKTGLPLKVVVTAKGQKSPAFSVGFSRIDFTKPAASLFEFTAPKDAKVTTKNLAAPKRSDSQKPGAGTSGHPKPVVTGTGWSTIVELPVGSARTSSGSGKVSGEASSLLGELTTPVSGGRALSTSLVSVLLTDDGRVLAGAVPVDALVAAAAK